MIQHHYLQSPNLEELEVEVNKYIRAMKKLHGGSALVVASTPRPYLDAEFHELFLVDIATTAQFDVDDTD